jgi:hypothetical protein
MNTHAGELNMGKTKLTDVGWVEVVCRQVDSLRFGALQIVVHDSRVMQIERTEKLRLDRQAARTIRVLSSNWRSGIHDLSTLA